jgi:hypothetical protein
LRKLKPANWQAFFIPLQPWARKFVISIQVLLESLENTTKEIKMPSKKKSTLTDELPVHDLVKNSVILNVPTAQPAPQVFETIISKPGLVQAIAVITLTSGIVSLMYGCFWMLGLIPTIICWPFAGYPIATGILEIVYAARLLQDHPRNMRPARHIAVMEICEVVFLNPIAMIAGILVLAFHKDPVVQEYFASINNKI